MSVAASTSAQMSVAAADRPTPMAVSDCQVENATPGAGRLDERPVAATGDEDRDGLAEERVERRHGVARVVDELGVAQGVGEHRARPLVVGVELVERVRQPLPGSRIARQSSRSGNGLAAKWWAEHASNRSASEGKWRYSVRRSTPARLATALSVVRAGPTDRCIYRRLGDPQVRLGHLGGSLLELVLALGRTFATHDCVANIDRRRRRVYLRISRLNTVY